MKTLFLLLLLNILAPATIVFAQFTDTAQLNTFLRQTFRDKRPDKITAQQLQQAFIGISNFHYKTAMDTISLSEAYELATDAKLVPGKSYYITNVDEDLYGGTDIILAAVTNKKFSERGIGFFYNPLYESYGNSSNGNGIWMGRETYIYVNDIIGSFNVEESITTEDGWSGQWITSNLLLTDDQGGTWKTDTTLTILGTQSEASAVITITQVPNYDSGAVVIWGGMAWINKTGHRGYYEDDFTLNYDDWELVPFENDTTGMYYTLVENAITFDFNSGRIIGRKEELGNNEVYATINWFYESDAGNCIKSFQWGNPYRNLHGYEIGAMKNQKIINSFNNTINFTGTYQVDVQMKNGSSQDNIYFGPNSYQKNIILDGSTQYGMYFVDSYQEDIYFKKSFQQTILLWNYGLQTNLNFTNSSQQALTINGAAQQNFNFWNYQWTRDQFELVSDNEEDIVKFGNFSVGGDGPVKTNVMFYDRENDWQSSNPISLSELDYHIPPSGNFNFEYQLFFFNTLGNSIVKFKLDCPDRFLIKTNYTLTNLTDNTIKSYTFSDIEPVAFEIGQEADGPYLLKITGVVISAEAGTFGLSFWPDTFPYANTHKVEAGSFAKFIDIGVFIL